MTTSSVRPVLRDGVEIESPLAVVLAFVEAYGHLEVPDVSPDSFGESDLRLANHGGARISAAEIATILECRRRIERALVEVAPDTSLAGATNSLPWPALTKLVEAFADIRGVGIAKMTKTLHRKRPALIPMLDSVVQRSSRTTTSGRRLRSQSARRRSSAATSVTWTATGQSLGRPTASKEARMDYSTVHNLSRRVIYAPTAGVRISRSRMRRLMTTFPLRV